MTAFTGLLAGIEAAGDGFTALITEDWLQGRTTYGGLSAALCVEAALRACADLPPLRSALFAFIGPAAGPVTIRPNLLRRGKSSAFVDVTLASPEGPATRATLCFAADRASAHRHLGVDPPIVPPPESCPPFFVDDRGPRFARQFESRRAGGAALMSGSKEPETLFWTRHKDTAARSTLALIALADVSPPPAMTMFTEPAPISTMTWALDLLDPAPAWEDGWYLCRAIGDSVGGGYSSQAMSVWTRSGRPVIVGRQMVALFS
jgi:acyl-CoA thioesterase